MALDVGQTKQSLQAHWVSPRHMSCMAAQNAERNARENKPAGPVDVVLLKLSQQNKDVLTKLFNSAYMIVKRDLPFTVFPEIPDLQIKNGRDINKLASFSDPDQGQPRCHIICCKFSPTGKYMVCVDDQKSLHLWQTNPWKILSRRTIPKRCTAVSFTNSERDVLVADKFGDVYRFPTVNFEEEGELLLGHVSMILDLAVTPDDKFVATCDRDEKIRISCLPNSYNIHGYCLGHTEFVSRCQILPQHTSTLLSVGGDDTLRLWNMEECSQISSCDINYKSRTKKPGERSTVTHLCCSQTGYAAIALLGERAVFVYKIQEDGGLRLTELTQLEFDAPILCVNFDLSGYLWVLQESPTNAARVYRIDQVTEDKVSRVEELPEAWMTDVLNSLAADWDFLQDAQEVTDPLASLHKKRYDNVKEYLEKKQERLAKEVVRREKYEERIARTEQRKRMKLGDGGGDEGAG